ncbi:hypothetical protein [Fodinibius sp. Rm-B-1B1-1]|uniref:hypothetical protein n=1 Tax=Fodinibius alkaliphilus TaxID=3140241 RepID=UPI00315A5E95
MKTIKFHSIIVATISLAWLFTSCEPSTNTSIEESFEYVKTVTPVQGAQSTSMNLQTGDKYDSFFVVTLADGSMREGWCIEWNDEYIKGDQDDVNMYSTKGHPQWETLNYFMSIKDQLKANDPNLTFREIQVIIWSLIDNPAFNVDNIATYDNIPSNIYSNGNTHFDIQKVKSIVAQVEHTVGSVQNKSSLNLPGVTLIENDGQTIMLGDETAFAVKTNSKNGQKAVNDNYSTCFDEEIIPNVSFNNWGWTNGPIAENSGELVYDIYAGAGQCDLSKGILVGQLTATYSNGTLAITYTMTETSTFGNTPYTLTETHLHVGTVPYPQLVNGQYTAAPGQYGNQNTHENITEYSYEVEGLSGDIYFIAHAVVNGFSTEE